MADDEEDRQYYDPTQPTPPKREPPYRLTAPQSEYTLTQVVFGFILLLVGVAITFGLPLLLT